MFKIPNKKKIFTIILITILIINILSATLIFSDIISLKTPKTEIEIKAANITPDEIQLDIKIKMINQNGFDIKIEDFKVTSTTNNGDKIGDINIQGGKIFSDKTKIFTTSNKIKFQENSDFNILKNRITGKIGVIFLGFIEKTIPLDINIITSVEEIFENIEIPKINLDLNFDHVTDEGIEFTSKINTFNPNNVDMTINKLTLEAYNLEKEKINSINIDGGTIKANTNSNFINKGILPYKLIDTKKINFILKGSASVKIAGLNKTLPFESSINVNIPDIKEFIFDEENIRFYIPVQFKLTLRGLQTTVGLKYYNPSNVTLIAKNINFSLNRIDRDKKTVIDTKKMEPCILNPKEEVCIKTELITPYIKYLRAGRLKIRPNWLVLTLEGDFTIAGTNQSVPLSLNAYVNPYLLRTQEFSE